MAMNYDPSVQHPPPERPVMRTSICTPSRHPDEVTVRFLRWTRVGGGAYQKHDTAGFLRPVAEELVANRQAVIVERG